MYIQGGSMILRISDEIEKKLRERHHVDQFEILQCFENQLRSALIDEREEHKTDPPTQWFISETDSGRRLKVVFIQLSALEALIKTAYEPDANEERIYQRFSARL
jgi:hypothetical protein